MRIVYAEVKEINYGFVEVELPDDVQSVTEFIEEQVKQGNAVWNDTEIEVNEVRYDKKVQPDKENVDLEI